MRKLNFETMEKIEGGDLCEALMYCIFACGGCNYDFCMSEFMRLCRYAEAQQ